MLFLLMHSHYIYMFIDTLIETSAHAIYSRLSLIRSPLGQSCSLAGNSEVATFQKIAAVIKRSYLKSIMTNFAVLSQG